MTNMASSIPVKPTAYETAAWIMMGIFLVGVLVLHLLPALLSGLLVYQLVHVLVPTLRLQQIAGPRAKIVSVMLLTGVVLATLTLAVVGIIAFFRGDNDNLAHLFVRLAEIVDQSRTMLPAAIVENFPADAEALHQTVVAWLREHAGDLKVFGKNTLRALAYIFVGMIIGAIIALRETLASKTLRPLAAALSERAERLGEAFRRVVFAQTRIAAINTFFTWIYLALILPMFDVHLPFLKTLIAVTFLAGLIPVLGNLISNTVIVIVSLSQSFGIAVASLLFLIIIHKAEYFLNAKIIGSHIRAAVWELLLVMITMEAIFGIPGVIAAPIFYAYVKNELHDRGLI